MKPSIYSLTRQESSGRKEISGRPDLGVALPQAGPVF